MGLFDLRCCVSRLPTDWLRRPTIDPKEPRRTVSMFLLERLGAPEPPKSARGKTSSDGRWVPWTPPVRGTYDRYGALELQPEDLGPYSAWVGATLAGLWTRSLRSVPADDRPTEKVDPARQVEPFFRVATDVVFNAVELTIGDAEPRQVRPCLVLDEVADALAAADPSPPKKLEAAFEAWFPEGGSGREHFDVKACPREGRAQLIRYASVASFVDGRGGFEPVAQRDGAQRTADQARTLTRAVYDKEPGAIRSLIERQRPEWTVRWKAANKLVADKAAELAEVEEAIAAGEATPYKPQKTFDKGDVIDHAKFGKGRVDEVDGDKIFVSFGATKKTLVHRLSA